MPVPRLPRERRADRRSSRGRRRRTPLRRAGARGVPARTARRGCARRRAARASRSAARPRCRSRSSVKIGSYSSRYCASKYDCPPLASVRGDAAPCVRRRPAPDTRRTRLPSPRESRTACSSARAQSRMCGNDVLRAARGLAQRVERARRTRALSRVGAQLRHALALLALGLVADLEQRDRQLRLVGDELVHADDHAAVLLDLPLLARRATRRSCAGTSPSRARAPRRRRSSISSNSASASRSSWSVSAST